MATTTVDGASIPGEAPSNRRQKILLRVVVYALLIAIALIILLPLFWMISTSLKPQSQWFSREIHWIPRTITLSNYELLFNNPATPIGRWFFNSVAVATITTV